ncbi:MAG: hypothetical protein AAB131_09435 [Actinomycetota bacterium]
MPGLDDGDPLCSAWSRYAASTQVVTVAANFGGLTELELARIELIAAPALLRAVADLAASFPSALGAERGVVFDDLVGPFERRADKAVARLTAVGIDETGIEALVDRWLAALRDRDPEQPVPVLDLADRQLAMSVERAATGYVGDVTTWTRDPSLDVGSVEVPLTVALLADRCPDLSTVGVGDAI